MAEPAGMRAFVVGHPIAHSRSPLIHNHWLRQFGIDGSYERVDVAPGDFAGFLDGLSASGYAGGNVTIPHKEAAFRIARRHDAAAELIGAANTLWLEDGVLNATNTDAAGFAASLDNDAPRWRSSRVALVLGAGGAARAILFALREAGIGDIRIVNRTQARARELADRFGGGISCHGVDAVGEIGADADFVVNTTALGMHGEDTPLGDASMLPDDAIVTDIVYTPLITPLLAAAAARGLGTVDGLGMLLHQAVPGFERWFGRRPEVTTTLRDLIIADLERGQ